jgi:hypothetical protein
MNGKSIPAVGSHSYFHPTSPSYATSDSLAFFEGNEHISAEERELQFDRFDFCYGRYELSGDGGLHRMRLLMKGCAKRDADD